jgi:DNA-binding protein YbaB
MKTALQQLLSEGKTGQVIAELLVAGRQSALERNINTGTARPDDIEVESNKIRAALLDLVKKLPEAEENTSPPSSSGTTIIQQAEKIYNIEKIDNAKFS